MKNKRIIAILLCVGMIVSSISVLFISPVWGRQIENGIPFIRNFSAPQKPGTIFEGNKKPDFLNLKSKYDKEMVAKIPEEDKPLYRGTKKSYSADRSNNDLFNYTQNDIEDLLKSGYAIEDILKADEIGNRILEDPKKLLEGKRSDNMAWAEVEKAVQDKRKRDYISTMQKKYQDVYNKFVKESLNEDDMALVFAYINNHEVKVIDDLIREYKSKGKAALISSETNKKMKISQEKMDKYGLSPQEVEGLSDEMLDRIEVISKKSNTPVKDLLKQFTVSRHNGEEKK